MFGRPDVENIALYTGCTACVVLLTEDEIICANAGDSRAVIS
jgi:serine/threonine protein phosphatase PrpC